MTEFKKGGYIPGRPLPPEYAGLHPDECICNIDLGCVRPEHDERHKGENMIDPKSCSEYDTYYGFVAGLERKLVRAEPWLDEPWVYEDSNGVRHSVSDRNVSHLSAKPRFLIEREPETELDQENQRLHNEWMIEHIRANAAEERVRQLEDYIRGEK